MKIRKWFSFGKGKEEECIHSSSIVWLFRLIRCQHGVVLPALNTRPFPGLFIIGLWHIVHNWVLFETTGAGETDDIPGPRPYYRRFNNTLHHDFNIYDTASSRRLPHCMIHILIFSSIWYAQGIHLMTGFPCIVSHKKALPCVQSSAWLHEYRMYEGK